jgi:hypothetical protein
MPASAHAIQPFFARWREARRLVPAARGGVDLLVSPPEACAAMRRAGNACAAMIVAEGCLITVVQDAYRAPGADEMLTPEAE